MKTISKTPHEAIRISMITLGCSKNTVDSERMLAEMGSKGMVLCADPADAQVILVNTCGFIDVAQQQSLDTLKEAVTLKRQNQGVSAVIATGCLSEHWGEKLLDHVPGLDGVIGLYNFEELPHLVQKILKKEAGDSPTVYLKKELGTFRGEGNRFRLTPQHYAYLKISEGCDHTCTFCTIPSFRGKHRSKPREELLIEAQELAKDGVRELILIGQDTTYYGKDLEGKFTLSSLLKDLSAIEGLHWIRLLYAYPACFTEELMEAIAQTPKVIPYVDMPLQHISDSMLRKMQRGITKKQTKELVTKMRARIPYLTLRTTFIVGFPGETEEDFAELCEFVEQTRFDCMGVFTYSDEETAPAYKLKEKLSTEVKEQRREKLMLIQQEIAFEKNEKRVGDTVEVIIDGAGRTAGWTEARSVREAPDIDGLILIKGNIKPGRFRNVELLENRGYDLVAKIL
ncbi:MAG: 30S ribosomal protein S12 methylthiotransferase RimO [Planctomycetota bacterium]